MKWNEKIKIEVSLSIFVACGGFRELNPQCQNWSFKNKQWFYYFRFSCNVDIEWNKTKFNLNWMHIYLSQTFPLTYIRTTVCQHKTIQHTGYFSLSQWNNVMIFGAKYNVARNIYWLKLVIHISGRLVNEITFQMVISNILKFGEQTNIK